MKSLVNLALAASVLTGAADAFWRMECHSRTGLARLDPLVEPNEVSSHAHVIHGGSNFGMDTTSDQLRASNCTSCLVQQDKSAYWTPSLHFRYDNGTFDLVPQVGGMLAYYFLFGENQTAFPKDFRMLAGDTRRRNFSLPVPDPPKSSWGPADTTQDALAQKALGFNCLNYGKDAEPSLYRHFMPDKAYMDANCPDGIRAEIMFPSCWNEKDSDSTDHKSHMAYPSLVMDGTCPPGFETRTAGLFFETIWNTAAFKSSSGEFVWANGDTTGYGYHGDFIMGWEQPFLQSAIQTCTNPSGRIGDCALFTLQTEPEAATCQMEMPQVLKSDKCAGPADGLCGNVPIQKGPGYASALNPGEPAGAPTSPNVPAATTVTPVPTLSYTTPGNVFTDKNGGGISVQAIQIPSAEGGSPAAEMTIDPQDLQPLPATTPAPVLPTQVPGGGKILSTTTYTSAGTVYEVAIEEIEVTVTVDAPSKQRRHQHHHMHMHRRDREHGLLGHRF